MDKKIKLIIVASAGILLLIILFIMLSLNAKTKAIKLERDQLLNENISLSKKIEETLNDARKLKEKIDSLNMDVARVSQEKQDLQNQKEDMQRQYELIVKERDVLRERLKSQPVPVKEEVQRVPEDAYWAQILKAKTDLEFQADKIQGELKSAQMQNEELQREKNVLVLDLNNLTREKRDLEQQVEYNQKLSYNLSSELALEKNMKNQVRASWLSIKNENAILRRQLKSLSNRKANLEKRLAQLQGEKSNLERRFNEMAVLLEERLANIGELKQQIGTISSGSEAETETPPQAKKESVELPPIVVRPQLEETTTPKKELALSWRGRILEVNKEDNFVIIDLGEDSGIKLGDTFQVYRENRAIATIEVMQVRKRIAACDIKSQSIPVRAGDTIR